jgi:hypothetical protein
MSFSSETSVRTNKPFPPTFSMSLIDSAPSASRLPAITTSAPYSAKAIPVARPIPEVPPVISTTFPANDGSIILQRISRFEQDSPSLTELPESMFVMTVDQGSRVRFRPRF